jgi:hypothetical protein
METFDGLFKGDPSYITKGCYASPKIDKPKELYANYTFYTHAYLKKGLELWHNNPIKLEIIPKFNLDKTKLYDLNKPSKESLTSDETELAKLNAKLVLSIGNYVLRQYPNYDMFNLMMAIAMERVLKGLLLYNGYIINEHKKKNRLTKISDLDEKLYTRLSEKVYSLDEFLEHDVLKNTLPWEANDDIVATMRCIEHLKMSRDMGVHCAIALNIFQIYDILDMKRVNNVMNKALEIDKIVYKKVEILKAEGKNNIGGSYGGLGVTVATGSVISAKNEDSTGNTPICLVGVQPDSPIAIPTIDQG